MTHCTARNCFVDAAENGPFNIKLAELKLCGGVTAFLADLEAVCPKGKDEEDKVFTKLHARLGSNASLS